MADLVLKDECYRVIGACFEVYKEKGCGFKEPVYQECLEVEFAISEIPADSQRPFALSYKGRPLSQKYIPDFICFDELLLEIKAVKALNDEHRAQVINYLRATNRPLGLLVNFAAYPKLQWERIAYTSKF
ncbi:GxxExxY protein [Pelagicoccus sp. SDUM812005]|nr:GxxExxY protein [Pelagicoccus sp. SDUM812005]MDQ8182013.1 GxxExxY protein [Pelagicoccus sp. SDUM812005]